MADTDNKPFKSMPQYWAGTIFIPSGRNSCFSCHLQNLVHPNRLSLRDHPLDLDLELWKMLWRPLVVAACAVDQKNWAWILLCIACCNLWRLRLFFLHSACSSSLSSLASSLRSHSPFISAPLMVFLYSFYTWEGFNCCPFSYFAQNCVRNASGKKNETVVNFIFLCGSLS